MSSSNLNVDTVNSEWLTTVLNTAGIDGEVISFTRRKLELGRWEIIFGFRL